MLLHQAPPGFREWFGTDPTVDQALRDHVLADLCAGLVSMTERFRRKSESLSVDPGQDLI